MIDSSFGGERAKREERERVCEERGKEQKKIIMIVLRRGDDDDRSRTLLVLVLFSTLIVSHFTTVSRGVYKYKPRSVFFFQILSSGRTRERGRTEDYESR